jgi:hypothetical protein
MTIQNNKIFVHKEKNVSGRRNYIRDATIDQNGNHIFLYSDATYGESTLDTIMNLYNPFIRENRTFRIYPNSIGQSYIVTLSPDGTPIWTNVLKDYRGRPTEIVPNNNGYTIMTTDTFRVDELILVSTNNEGKIPGCDYAQSSVPISITDVNKKVWAKETRLTEHSSSFRLQDVPLKEATGSAATLDIEHICE